MNLTRAKRIIEGIFKEMEIDFEYDEKEDKVNASARVNFEDLDAVGFCSFTFFASGMVMYRVLFDEIDEEDEEVCQLLNEFNKNSWLFKATADEYLTVEHTVCTMHEEDIEDYTGLIFEEFISDDFTDYLKPLIDLCEA